MARKNEISSMAIVVFAMKPLRFFTLLQCVSFAIFFWAAASPAADEHNHAALPEDPSLTLFEVLEETYVQYPTTIELEARNQQAKAWTDRGNSWLSNRPSLTFRYQSDRWGDDAGVAEFESGIALPLWRWGGRTKTQELGQAMSVESGAARDALRWELAGQIRSALWEIALADNNHELAEEALATATQLNNSVERRYSLGDVPLSDFLLSQSARLDAETELIQASAVLLDTERLYASLTKLQRRPPFHGEVQSTKTDVGDDHPAMVFANAEVDRSEARHSVARQTAKGNPTLLIGPRRERAALAQSFDESVGVSISVPFGGTSYVSAQSADASRDVAGAQAARGRLFRMLELQFHEAEHSLFVARQSQATARERADIAAQQFAMGESAYETGELDIIDLLKLRDSLLAAKRQLISLDIEETRQIAFYNQAVGELP